jgi:hypothetical protein
MPLTRLEAAAFLTAEGYPIKASTLNHMFTAGGGPKCVHFGRKPLHEKDELLAWARSRTSQPRSKSIEPKQFATAAPPTAPTRSPEGKTAVHEATMPPGRASHEQ